jgi:hypothetical protein
LENQREQIERLALTIERLHDCSAALIETIYVTEVVGGQIVWEGHVHTYLLIGHEKANRCYGWISGEEQVAMHIPPVDSPERAVKAVMEMKLLSATLSSVVNNFVQPRP